MLIPVVFSKACKNIIIENLLSEFILKKVRLEIAVNEEYVEPTIAKDPSSIALENGCKLWRKVFWYSYPSLGNRVSSLC